MGEHFRQVHVSFCSELVAMVPYAWLTLLSGFKPSKANAEYFPAPYFSFLELNSTTLYHAAPPSVINMPTPFKTLTLTPKITMPSRTVRHCFTFPHTVMVSAPVFLFVENELTFNTNAKIPFPAKASVSVQNGSGSVVEVEGGREEARQTLMAESSSVRCEYRRACTKARGDMRKRISRGERARGPVMMRFVTTVWREG